MSLQSKLRIFLSILGILAIVVLYVQEFQWFQNYLNPRGMLFGSIGVGFAIGLFLGFRFQGNGEELVDRMQIWTVCIVLSLLPMPLLASLTNRLFAEQQVHQTEVEFWEEKPYALGGFITKFDLEKGNKKDLMGYFEFVVKDGKLLRLQSNMSRFPNAKRGDIVTLPIRNGFLNADFVDWENQN